MQECTACKHPKRAEIDAALVAGATSLRDIAGQFGLSRSALFRHRAHIPAALTKAKEAGEIAQANTLLARVNEVISKAENIAGKALAANEFAAAVRGLGEVRQCLELLGELSGELQRGDDIKVAVMNVNDLSAEDQSDLQMCRRVRAMTDEERAAHRRHLAAVVDGTATQEDFKAIARAADAERIRH